MNRDDLIAYLLHQIPEEERARLAEQWSADAELYEQLRMAEAELLDAYVRDEIPPKERSLVEQHLLASERQRRKLEFAETLHAILPGVRKRSTTWLGLAAASVIIVLGGGAFWLEVQNRALRRDAVARTQMPQPATSAGGVYAVFLPSTTVRGPTNDIQMRLPAGAEIVRLDLELEPGDERETFTAILRSSGRDVWTEAPIRAASRGSAFVAPIWIPVSALSVGSLEVNLETGGRAIAFYRARIER